jgi:hypothetical protein
MSKSLVTRRVASLVAFILAFAPIPAPLHAAEQLHKLAIVSFGLFGDQDVFRSEASARRRSPQAASEPVRSW